MESGTGLSKKETTTTTNHSDDSDISLLLVQNYITICLFLFKFFLSKVDKILQKNVSEVGKYVVASRKTISNCFVFIASLPMPE